MSGFEDDSDSRGLLKQLETYLRHAQAQKPSDQDRPLKSTRFPQSHIEDQLKTILERLLPYYQEPLTDLIRRTVDSKDAVEDIWQNTCLECIVSVIHLHNPYAFYPWLKTITERQINKWIREQIRHRKTKEETRQNASDLPPVSDQSEIQDVQELFMILINEWLDCEASKYETRITKSYYFKRIPVRRISEKECEKYEKVKSDLRRVRAKIRKYITKRNNLNR